MIHQQIQLAVFDIAGTTVADNNHVAQSFRDAFATHGIAITAQLVNPLMGYHKPLAIKMVLEKLEEEFDENLIYSIHDEFEELMIDFYEHSSEVVVLPGAEEIFTLFKERGIHIALNTGFSKNIADTIVDRLQWKHKNLIDEYIGSDEVASGRPAPLMIRELMRRTNVHAPELVAKIGDTTVDVEEGRNAQCGYVVAVTTGAASREMLPRLEPTHIIDHLGQLPEILQL